MKRVSKIHSKKGFTLVETVLVIAILVILSAVFFISITGYVDRANNCTATIAAHNAQALDAVSYID